MGVFEALPGDGASLLDSYPPRSPPLSEGAEVLSVNKGPAGTSLAPFSSQGGKLALRQWKSTSDTASPSCLTSLSGLSLSCCFCAAALGLESRRRHESSKDALHELENLYTTIHYQHTCIGA